MVAAPGAPAPGVLVRAFDRLATRPWPAPAIYASILAVGTIPTLALNVLAGLVGEPPTSNGQQILEALRSHPVRTSLLVVLVFPFVETLLLWGVVAAARRLLRSPDAGIVVGAAVLVALHLVRTPLRAAVLFWPFLIYAAALYSSRFRTRRQAVGVVFALHGAHNALLTGLHFALQGNG